MGIEVRQTIDLCRSEKGQGISSKAEKLEVKFAKAWDEDGAARQVQRDIAFSMQRDVREGGPFNCQFSSTRVALMFVSCFSKLSTFQLL